MTRARPGSGFSRAHCRSVPRPLLATPVFWVPILFTLRSIRPTPRPRRGGPARLLGVTGAPVIFLILEMDRPFDGFITVLTTPMRDALAHMGA